VRDKDKCVKISPATSAILRPRFVMPRHVCVDNEYTVNPKINPVRVFFLTDYSSGKDFKVRIHIYIQLRKYVRLYRKSTNLCNLKHKFEKIKHGHKLFKNKLHRF